MCVNESILASVCVSLAFALALFLLFVLSYPDLFLFCFILLLFLGCLVLFSIERQKGHGSRWEGRWGGTGRSWQTRNHTQNILYKINNLFSIKKNKTEIL